MSALFWISLAVVLGTYVGYPLLVAAWARLRPRPVRREPFAGSVSIVLAVRNEAANLRRRIPELLGYLRPGDELIVVSDGSTDGTPEVLRSFAQVRGVILAENVGKASAVTQGCHAASNEILVFADARQTWHADALAKMLENFADPEVGAVSGDLVLESSPGILAGVGLYWRFEKWLRRQESLVYSQVGVTGAIAACRRTLFTPIPPGILLDDVYWPLHVALAGFRVVHEEAARAVDRLPSKSRDEFRRKVRTLAGNFQLAALVPASLLPWRNPVWLAWMLHKLARLLVPWAYLGLLVASACMEPEWGRWFLGVQVAGTMLGLLGLIPPLARRVKLLGAGASFLVLNAAAWVAFWVWISGGAGSAWKPIHYVKPT